MIGGNCFACLHVSRVFVIQTLNLHYASVVLCFTKSLLVSGCVTVDSSYSVPSLLHGISFNISNAIQHVQIFMGSRNEQNE